MLINKHIALNKHLQRCCSVLAESKQENSEPASKIKTVESKSKGPNKEMRQFFKSNSELSKAMSHIPPKYLKVNSLSEHHYLVCEKTANLIANKVMPFLDLSGKQLIAETNTGLGLITLELLKNGVKLVRMYESCSEFRVELKDFGRVFPNCVELFTKDLFHVSRYEYMDKRDRMNRVEKLFKNVPKRSWTDEPFMTIIGPMNGFSFLQYLVHNLALQIIPSTFGRLQIFALMKAKDYAVLTATTKDSSDIYRKLTVLFNLVFDIECLDAFPKKLFLPWSRKKELVHVSPYKNVDLDKRYLVRINFKKDFDFKADELLHFSYFLKQFFIAGNAFVLPKLEKWLPGSGINLISPKLKHKEYYEKFSIFTKFRELNPQQFLAVFREMANHPAYGESSFLGMVRSELMQSETVETDIADIEFESKLLEDFEEKMNDDK